MAHFVSCAENNTPLEIDWKLINENNIEYQIAVSNFIQNRQKTRQKVIRQREVGHTSAMGSTAPGLL